MICAMRVQAWYLQCLTFLCPPAALGSRQKPTVLHTVFLRGAIPPDRQGTRSQGGQSVWVWRSLTLGKDPRLVAYNAPWSQTKVVAKGWTPKDALVSNTYTQHCLSQHSPRKILVVLPQLPMKVTWRSF